MDHPAVAQCLTFGVPHAKLGEEVGAAVVLRDGQTVKDTELREFCGQRLTAFKVPRRIVFLDEIPEGRHRQAAAHRAGGETGADGMKVAIFGAGAIGGFLGVRLAQAGVDVTFIARGPHLAAMQANGVTLRSGGDSVTVRPRCVAIRRRSRHAGLCRGDPEGARAAGGGALDRGDDGAGQRPGDRHQRRPLLVFLRPGRPVPRPGGRSRRSRRAAVDRAAAVPGNRLRRLSGGRGGRTGRDRAHLRRPLHPGRARRIAQRPGRGLLEGVDRRRAEGAGAAHVSATNYGSSCGAISHSTRSAR